MFSWYFCSKGLGAAPILGHFLIVDIGPNTPDCFANSRVVIVAGNSYYEQKLDITLATQNQR